ncbi:CPBP family intramembrane glutamic endopeptidase [Vagococcus silagei]|uniref:CPBP family intramembrane metalloprotease n=1 Tax=Vagococcus silagei TaxID=2508885 RepID=A0A4V3TUS9_9ENTE|nr:CPBP family intramembrane glutamic endopeptidase [Vagococcus silagei]THB60179.1 CPBP family intramembrane metalloprotease [Vagococcus silagei]
MKNKKMWAVFVFFVFVLSLNGILNAITENFGDSKNQTAVVSATKEAPLLFVILLFVILGPFLEEIIFRKILITELSQIIDKRIAISFSISSFVLIRVHQPIDIVNYLPVAVVFTYAYLKSGQHLSFSLSIHVMNNTFAILFPLLINKKIQVDCYAQSAWIFVLNYFLFFAFFSCRSALTCVR